ncbi:MAG: iron-containing alcohol dehydrogenase [Clostridiales bacterium]|jgi:alcohol dehydrogenase YqhD (iron-dependent ADH family)|nr:iron-containing alcohol dehydrogenase [Clostridiales bacterium]
MQNFEFYNPTHLVFGKDTQKRVGELVKKHNGNRVLVVYGGGSVKKSGLLDEVKQYLKEADITFYELGGVVPNPRWDLVEKGVQIVKENNLDFVLGVGGGSVIDTVKAICMQAVYDGDAWTDFYLNQKEADRALPNGNILTIAAAGSESSPNTVITHEKDKFKIGAYSRAVIPKFAILNPELIYTVPKYQVGCGASDILAHLMERYFTNEKNVDLTDRLIEAVAKTIIHYTPLVLKNPQDYNAQAEFMFAGTIAHNGLLNCGRIGDWASHGIEHQLSLFYDIAHGAGLAIIFPAWIKYVYKHNINRFAQFFQNVFGLSYSLCDMELTVLQGIQKLEDFYTSIGMPVRLRQIGIGDENFKLMAQKAVDAKSVGNLVPLDPLDIEKIYRLAL